MRLTECLSYDQRADLLLEVAVPSNINSVAYEFLQTCAKWPSETKTPRLRAQLPNLEPYSFSETVDTSNEYFLLNDYNVERGHVSLSRSELKDIKKMETLELTRPNIPQAWPDERTGVLAGVGSFFGSHDHDRCKRIQAGTNFVLSHAQNLRHLEWDYTQHAFPSPTRLISFLPSPQLLETLRLTRGDDQDFRASIFDWRAICCLTGLKTLELSRWGYPPLETHEVFADGFGQNLTVLTLLGDVDPLAIDGIGRIIEKLSHLKELSIGGRIETFVQSHSHHFKDYPRRGLHYLLSKVPKSVEQLNLAGAIPLENLADEGLSSTSTKAEWPNLSALLLIMRGKTSVSEQKKLKKIIATQNFSNVIALNLGGNHFGNTAWILAGKNNFPALKYLFVEDCEIRGGDLQTLETLNSPLLESIDLSGNPMTAEDVDYVLGFEARRQYLEITLRPSPELSFHDIRFIVARHPRTRNPYLRPHMPQQSQAAGREQPTACFSRGPFAYSF